MNCPFCGADDTRVINSRVAATGDSVRRRRECQSCHRRFTTFEYVEQFELVVTKRNGAREPFSLQKLESGLQKACEKRPVSPQTIDKMVRNIERTLMTEADREVSSEEIGRLVLKELKEVDHVAYLRFASVYKQFHDLQDFNAEIRSLLKTDQA
jgi:transcriptional repressor NrdR